MEDNLHGEGESGVSTVEVKFEAIVICYLSVSYFDIDP